MHYTQCLVLSSHQGKCVSFESSTTKSEHMVQTKNVCLRDTLKNK